MAKHKVYIDFFEAPAVEGRKTKRWQVRNKFDGSYLGSVGWFTRWRQYCFFPHQATVFERHCLSAIALFCSEETDRHRAANKKAK